MKTIRLLLFSATFLMTAFVQAKTEGNENIIEKKKSIIKIYDVSSKNNLMIDNQFGLVKVNLWSKNEIKVEITIRSNSSSETRADERLNRVDIVERINGGQIGLQTVLEKERSSFWEKSSSWRNDEKEYLRIDYTISMPNNISLSVKNSFGDTDIPMFSAPLVVHSSYGSFTANELTGSNNDIDVNFGKATIQEINNGNLEIGYSSLDLNKANVLKLVNKFGQFKIGDVERMDGNVSYSGNSRIRSVKNSCKIKLSFSGGFRIEQILNTADNVDISSSYSTVSLPTENNDCEFDVKVSYGGFKFPSGRVVTFTQNDDNDRGDKGPRFTKQYIGHFGKGGGTKVKVVSSFGEVSLK